MSTASWVVHAKGAVKRAWRRARIIAFLDDSRREMRRAKQSTQGAWWSDMQDRWAEEDNRWGERWTEGTWQR
jgi:hypothetical protein